METTKVKVEIDADLQDLVPQFVENRKKDLESFGLLIQQNDLVGIGQLAHKVKGAAAGYGFAQLSQLAADMENAAKAGDQKTLSEILKRMKDHFLNIDIHYVIM